jgi:membrane-bound lytic murein transglycosylase MltF
VSAGVTKVEAILEHPFPHLGCHSLFDMALCVNLCFLRRQVGKNEYHKQAESLNLLLGKRRGTIEELKYLASRLGKWRTVLCLACLTGPLLLASSKKETPQERAAIGAVNQTAAPAPFGIHTDDLDEMLKRRNIRALVMINPIGFFYSNGQPMGVMYEGLRELESYINQKMKTGVLKVNVTFIPLRPDQMEAALTQGVGDFVAYALVVTPARQQKVAFTVPLQNDVKHVIVTGPNFGTVSSLEELGGKQVYVNPLTVNYERLQQVNDKLQKAGKPLIVIKTADKNLLDDDLVQMVNAGLIPATATSEARAELWSQVLPNLTVHHDLVIASGEQAAFAVRKDNPQLKQLLDEFIAPRAVGNSFGNILLRRYLQNTKWVKNSTSPEEMKKFAALSALFKQYASQYDFDYLMIMAQGYQESLLNQNKRSPSGAVGIMQVIPKDAAASPINVPNVATVENNILAGVKMLRNIEDQYFNDPKIDPLDKTLMSFASYNAGPNRIARLRQQAGQQGLDPDKWFSNVELMVAKDVGQETVTYVGNVYKYYVAYKLALGKADAR